MFQFQLPAFQFFAELFSGANSGNMDANSNKVALSSPNYTNVKINPPVLQELVNGSKSNSPTYKGRSPSATNAAEIEVNQYSLRPRGKLRLMRDYNTQDMNEMVSTSHRRYHSAYSSGKASWRSNSTSQTLTPSSLSLDTYHTYTPSYGPTHNSSETLEDLILAKNGYRLEHKLCNTLQGECFKARIEKYHRTQTRNSFVAIKKIDRKLSATKTVEQGGMTFIVEEDIIKEAVILKHLTVDNSPTGDYIVKFVDLFKTDTHFYLVTEFVDGMSLKEFVRKAHCLINQGKLHLKEWSSTIKYLVWKLVSVLRWLHDVTHCCHLDLAMENVMVSNVDFKSRADGTFSIDTSITIKVIDFGVSEIFDVENGVSPFLCTKDGLTIDNEIYLAPEVFSNRGEEYDARGADMWSLGIIFYQCMTGKALYNGPDFADIGNPKGGYRALVRGQLQGYLSNIGLLQMFKVSSFKLLKDLLQMDPKERITASQVVSHDWFKSYWRKYQVGLDKKHALDAKTLKDQRSKMYALNFPFYRLAG